MANIKVIDINEADVKLANSSHELCDKQEEPPVVEEDPIIEEAKPEEILNEVVEQTNEETASGSLNSNKVGVETKEEIEEEQPKHKAKPKPSDRVDCNTCGKNLSYKNYRYRHEKLCSAEPKPVKAQAKPKAKVKMMPKPTFKTVEVNEQSQEEQPQKAPKQTIKQQIPQQLSQPSNPLHDITNHYQLLQNQFIQQKKEKYNNLCQSMFAPKSKKR